MEESAARAERGGAAVDLFLRDDYLRFKRQSNIRLLWCDFGSRITYIFLFTGIQVRTGGTKRC